MAPAIRVYSAFRELITTVEVCCFPTKFGKFWCQQCRFRTMHAFAFGIDTNVLCSPCLQLTAAEDSGLHTAQTFLSQPTAGCDGRQFKRIPIGDPLS